MDQVMKMKLSKREEAAFLAAGEPRTEPDDYTDAADRLRRTLPPPQREQLTELLLAFGELVRFERRWYFHKGYQAAKKETK